MKEASWSLHFWCKFAARCWVHKCSAPRSALANVFWTSTMLGCYLDHSRTSTHKHVQKHIISVWTSAKINGSTDSNKHLGGFTNIHKHQWTSEPYLQAFTKSNEHLWKSLKNLLDLPRYSKCIIPACLYVECPANAPHPLNSNRSCRGCIYC